MVPPHRAAKTVSRNRSGDVEDHVCAGKNPATSHADHNIKPYVYRGMWGWEASS
jgi:hypothetical protein